MDFRFNSKETRDKRQWVLTACLFLLLVSLAVYWQVGHFDFINFDDSTYVTGNRHIRSGLTAENIFWSFSFQDKQKTYWHPLTWISHMLDVELYGMNPGRHHLNNVLFHVAGTLLLFLALHRMTGALWRSAFVAALFALHPINVESVAWIAERKNVLSTFFWMLTLLAYGFYHERPSMVRYLMVLFVFALGLLAKPMLVTLPFVLLLLDYWPLGQKRSVAAKGIYGRTVGQLIIEKIPLFVLSGLSVYLSSSSLRGMSNYMPLESIPMTVRIGNALVCYVKYIGKMIWPAHLAVFYPYPNSLPIWQVVVALIFIICVSIFVIRMLKQYAYLAVGWFWFIGTLIPVSGLVQAGLWPAMADRWAYVPLIGLFIMLVWSAGEIFDSGRIKRFLAVPIAVVVMLALSAVSHVQVTHWANSITLFSHALKVNQSNYLAHLNLGKTLNDAGRASEAFQHYSAAVRINPNSAHVHVNLGSALLARGKIGEAMDHFYQALQINPDFAEAHNNLGLAMVRIGNIEDSIHHFRLALKTNPKFTNAMINLNLATSINDNINRAVGRMRESLRIDALRADFDLKMIELSNRKRDVLNAVGKYRTALSKQPGFSGWGGSNPAAVAAVMQQYEELLPLLLEKIKFQSTGAEAYYHVACICARKGRFHESNKWLNQAMTRDRDRWHFFQTDPDLVGIQKSDSDLFKNSDAVHSGADFFSKPSNEILGGLRII